MTLGATHPSRTGEARARPLRHRLFAPLRTQLTQGVSPEKLAATIGLGTACSLLPFLGFTSLLNAVVGLALRLNQPILQLLNQVLGPLQLLLIIPYVRAGEWLWGASADPLTVDAIVRTFREASLADFFAQFGRAGLHALTAWLLTAPLLAAAGYAIARPALRRLLARP